MVGAELSLAEFKRLAPKRNGLLVPTGLVEGLTLEVGLSIDASNWACRLAGHSHSVASVESRALGGSAFGAPSPVGRSSADLRDGQAIAAFLRVNCCM